MEKLDEKFEQFLTSALGVFMKYGIKSVTMDDLARHLGISKKTIYKYVKDKNDLVLKGVEYQQHLEHCTFEAFVNKGMNAIDEIFEITKIILEQLRGIHPSVMYDLEKYHPEATTKMAEYRNTVIKDWVRENLNRGIAEGLYRDDLNTSILTNMYVSRMHDLFDTDIFPSTDFTFEEVYLEIFRYHIRGIASEKGTEYLKEKIKELNKR